MVEWPQVDRPSHHGLTAFQKLHRDDAKRRFKRGLLKLRAVAKLSILHAAFKVTKATLVGFGPPRTAEEKKGVCTCMCVCTCVSVFVCVCSRSTTTTTTTTAAVSVSVAGITAFRVTLT
jgi:hypothetical protein